MKPNELTDELLIEEFNKCELSIPKIAEKYGIFPASKLKSRIKSLQNKGLLGLKNKAGKLIKEGEKKEKTESLGDILSKIDSSNTEENISTLHKEMLIEILHRIIVK